MSEDKVRYFQGSRTGYVVRAGDEEAALAFDLNPAMTEVQVVPLDARVIGQLPEIAPSEKGEHFYRGPYGEKLYYATSAEEAEDDGRALLAIADRLRKHPPVDEAQVKALNDIYEDWSQPHNYGVSFGQYLAERGVRVGDA